MKGHPEQTPLAAGRQFVAGHGKKWLVKDHACFEQDDPDSAGVLFQHKEPWQRQDWGNPSPHGWPSGRRPKPLAGKVQRVRSSVHDRIAFAA